MKYSDLPKNIQDMIVYKHLNEKSDLYFKIVCILFALDNNFDMDKISEKIDDFDVDNYVKEIGHIRVVETIHKALVGLDEINNKN